MEWIEIPAHRILKLTKDEFKNDFVFVPPDGEHRSWQALESVPHMICTGDIKVYRIQDMKQFRVPRFHYDMADLGSIYFLEEV